MEMLVWEMTLKKILCVSNEGFVAADQNCVPALYSQIQDAKGDVTITNDGATILKQMQVLHPAAKMVSGFFSILCGFEEHCPG